MFSIICIYNNPDILKSWLAPELCSQKANHEKFFIDNTNNRFTSAAETFNKAIALTHGEYIMFIHQDVRFEDENWLERAESYIKKLPDAGVVGVAGLSETGKNPSERGRNFIKWGNPPEEWGWSNAIQSPAEVQTLDECLFIVPKQVFSLLDFDNYTCDNWHLYAVDLCLAAKRLGFKNYVLPLSIWHKGTFNRIVGLIPTLLNGGHLPKSYYRTLKKLLTKYRKDFDWIYTTCGDWNTQHFLFPQRVFSLYQEFISRNIINSEQKDFSDYRLEILNDKN